MPEGLIAALEACEGADQRRQQVAEAVARIKPLPGNGPNHWTVDMPGWGLSAPTKRELSLMVWAWCAPDLEPTP